MWIFILVGHADCAIKSQNISGESKTSADGDFDRSDFQNNALNARFWIFFVWVNPQIGVISLRKISDFYPQLEKKSQPDFRKFDKNFFQVKIFPV